MPELPEVENLRSGLEREIVGQKIRKILVRNEKLISGKGNIRKIDPRKTKEFLVLAGETFSGVGRRAKNLIFKFKSGKVILAHLKMSGQFIYVRKGAPTELPNKHTHIIFELEEGALFFNDIRKFGYVLYFPKEKDLEGYFKEYGLEPLSKEFTLQKFKEKLGKKKGILKGVLMGQTVVVGLGNIYADESCFLSKIRPDRKVQSLSEPEIEELFKAIKFVLKAAIRSGGSSIRNYRLVNGESGDFVKQHKVYGRAGKECVRCGRILKKQIVGGRTTVLCGNCQK